MKLSLLPSLLPLLAGTASASLAYKGMDWSSLLLEEASGQTYKTSSGSVSPLETILKTSGVNAIRQRLWVGSGSADYALAYNLKLGKRAHAANLKIYLDLFYSSTWTDPAHQTTPSAWAGFDIDDLTWEVYNYTLSTMDSFQAAGVPLSIVAIGNEITAGVLWPLGELSSNAYNTARILHSASSAIKASSISPKPKILIHLDNGWNWSTQQWWYKTVLAEGPLTTSDFDIQGVSYYPFYNSAATLASLKSSLTNLKASHGKDVMVVETNWPASCPSPKYTFPSDAKSIPFSAAGQSTWLKDVAAAVEAAGGDGLFYWEGAWINNAALGSSCANNLLFDNSGKALNSLATLGSL